MATEKKPSNLHPEFLKMYGSPVYRKKVKFVVESIKNVRGISSGKLPGKPKPLSKNATAKEKEAFSKKSVFIADRTTAHYFAQTIDAGADRRSRVTKPEQK